MGGLGHVSQMQGYGINCRLRTRGVIAVRQTEEEARSRRSSSVSALSGGEAYQTAQFVLLTSSACA